MHKRPVPDELSTSFLNGAIAALRKGAEAQRKIAIAGTSLAGEKFPGVVIRSPEAACATKLAANWDAIADEIGGDE